MWSTIAASSATRSGLASGSTCTAKPTRMRLVRAATAQAPTSGEASTARCGRKCDSPSQKNVYTHVFGKLHHVKPFLKGLRLGKAFAGVEHGEDAKVHRHFLSCQGQGSSRVGWARWSGTVAFHLCHVKIISS